VKLIKIINIFISHKKHVLTGHPETVFVQSNARQTIQNCQISAVDIQPYSLACKAQF
jgi:hypothetical protein